MVAITAEYGVPTVPFGRVEVVMVTTTAADFAEYATKDSRSNHEILINWNQDLAR